MATFSSFNIIAKLFYAAQQSVKLLNRIRSLNLNSIIKSSCFLLALLGGKAFADGYSQWGKITELYYGSAGDYLAVTMNVSDSSKYCSVDGRPYILKLDSSSDTLKEFYKTRSAAILTAYAANKEIKFYHQSNKCHGGQPIIYGLGMRY